MSWVASIPGFSPQMVATQLPAVSQWSSTGFVTVSVVGGTPHPDLPLSQPVIQVDCYAVKPNSNKPNWLMAASLASALRYACWDRVTFPRLLSISSNGKAYPSAAVRSAYMTIQPRRVYADPGDYARYSTDIALVWAMTNDRLD